MSNLRPPLPPVLSRQVSRVIALPTRATPLKHIPVISNAGHVGDPVRLAGGRGASSPHIPSHADIMSTIQPGVGGLGGPGTASSKDPNAPLILTSGTYDVGGPGNVAHIQVAHVSFPTPRACTLYVGIVPGSAVDTSGLFTLLGTVKVGRDKGAARFNFDIPAPVTGTTGGLWGRGPLVKIPLVGQDIDCSVRVAPFGSANNPAFYNNQDPNFLDDPPDVGPGAIPAQHWTLTAFICEGESVPSSHYPARHFSTLLAAGGHLLVPVCMGCDRALVLADPSGAAGAQMTWEQLGPGGFDIINLPVTGASGIPIPISSFADRLKLTNNTATQSQVDIIQYLSI